MIKRPAEPHGDQPQSPAAPGLGGRLVAAGGDISGIASTGDDAMNLQYRAERMTVLPAEAFRPWAELAVPAGLSNLPQPGLFVGRDRVLARLDAAMAGPGGVVVQAVHGLGGVGKSTLAARWAAAHAAKYTLTWWITAATTADIDAGLADLAVALQPALTGVLPLEALREGAVQWLAAHSGWLVILDNVTDPADVAPLLARARRGRYLITSRRATGWHATGMAPVRLDVLDPAEAQDLLAAILTPDRPDEPGRRRRAVRGAGFLPLAIEQAGAYLAQAGTTPRDYLALLARYPAAMYQAAPEGGDAARTIARIWRVTLDRLADDPLAGQVLRILAWYAPDAIPRTCWTGWPTRRRCCARSAAWPPTACSPPSAGTLAVHRLVQAVTRTPDPADPHRDPQAIDDARDQATRLLAAALPDLGGPGRLADLADAAPAHRRPGQPRATGHRHQATACLLNQAGLFLDDQGQPARAAGYLQRALAGCERVLGEDHPDTLASRNNLAAAYQAAGDLGRAIPLYEQTLADRAAGPGRRPPRHPDLPQQPRRRLPGGGGPGPGHPAVRADPRRPAAGPGRRPPRHPDLPQQPRLRLPGGGGSGPGHPAVRADPRRPAAGPGRGPPRHADLPQQPRLRLPGGGGPGPGHPAVRAGPRRQRRVLGEDHPDTLTSRNNLAGAYQAAGDLGRAIPLYEQALTDRQRVLGEDHPDTLASRNNLAAPTRRRGIWAGPSRCIEQTLADRQRVLGDDHPDTLASRNNLADAYQAAGDLGRAIPLIEQALADWQRVLGEDHPDTLTSRNNLADAYQAAGDLGRAIPLYEQVLADRRGSWATTTPTP